MSEMNERNQSPRRETGGLRPAQGAGKAVQGEWVGHSGLQGIPFTGGVGR